MAKEINTFHKKIIIICDPPLAAHVCWHRWLSNRTYLADKINELYPSSCPVAFFYGWNS